MHISIASYAFHGLLGQGAIDVFGYLESVKYRYGLDAADIWNGMLVSTEEDYLRTVREALDERELTLVNLCVDGAHLWDPDPAERDRLYATARANLRAAVILGARTVRLDMGGHELEMTPEQLDYTVMRYREYAQFAADHGFRVGTENHWGASRRIANQLAVIRGVDHPAYGVLLHFSNWADDDPTASERQIAPYVMHTHVAANVVRDRLLPRMQCLFDVDYAGYWGVEHHSGANEYAEVAWQLAEVRRVLAHRRSGTLETVVP